MKKLIIVILFLFVTIGFAQTLNKINIQDGKLSEKFEKVFKKHQGSDNIWIGYEIKVDKPHGICIGHCYLGDENETYTIGDMIDNTAKYQKYKQSSFQDKNMFYGSVRIYHGRSDKKNEGSKRIAILFKYDRNSENISDFAEASLSDFNRCFDFQNLSLYWLGKIDNNESASYLVNQYESGNNFVKEELFPLIGVQNDEKIVTTFLIKEFKLSKNHEIREDALFWLGNQNNKKAFEFLKDVLKSNESEEILASAVMGIAQLDFPAATDELIRIAKDRSNMEVREEAVLMLGQKAVEKANLALKDFIENDPDIEIKKRALYALMESEKNIDYLINIARNHTNLKLRKTAIYSLSNSENEKAIETIIDLAKK